MTGLFMRSVKCDLMSSGAVVIARGESRICMVEAAITNCGDSAFILFNNAHFFISNSELRGNALGAIDELRLHQNTRSSRSQYLTIETVEQFALKAPVW
jgi:hypothetical protein